jgi:hypothetical protein
MNVKGFNKFVKDDCFMCEGTYYIIKMGSIEHFTIGGMHNFF